MTKDGRDIRMNLSLREHETSVDWRLVEKAKLFYKFFDLFNEEFFEGRLLQAVISFERTRVTSLGHFVVGRNQIALNDNINSRYIGSDDFYLLAVLLHEQTHLWQKYFGKPGKGWYHNKQFIVKAIELGIICDSRGHILKIEKPFISFLAKYGIDKKSDLILVGSKGQSKLRKWTCGCTIVRVGRKDFMDQCLYCGNRFFEV